MLLHVALLACPSAEVAANAFSAFYAGYHVPRALCRSSRRWRGLLVGGVLALLPFCAPRSEVALAPWHLRAITAHCFASFVGGPPVPN